MASPNASADQFLHRHWFMDCIFSNTDHYIYIMPSFVAIWGCLLFPLYVLVLHIGFQKWRRNKRSTISHTDFFTYHSFVFQLLVYCGYVTIACAASQSYFQLAMRGMDILAFAYCGLQFLQVFICVERYLAVVYPVVFVSLRNQQWIRARNVLMIVLWGVCFLWMWMVHFIPPPNETFPIGCLMVGTVGVIIFCCIKALRALRNPSPGEGRGVSQSKRKAFNTMLAILFVLSLWFTGGLISHVFSKFNLEPDVMCKLQLSNCWLELPSSLVLPLLLLKRTGKLPKCRGKQAQNPGQL